MLFGRKSGGIQWLIVGLGNPGEKYARTRHNLGFLALDLLAEQQKLKINRIKYKALVAETEFGGARCLLMKPQTYMNLSGVAVEKAASFYKIPPENVLVLFDDISLEPGKLRIRRKGTHGGHNGIRSIIDYLQSDNFPRVKLGVGAKPNPNYDLADWVLSTFTEAERKSLNEAASHCKEIAELVITGAIEKAMNLYNS